MHHYQSRDLSIIETILEQAYKLAEFSNHEYVTVEHIFCSLLDDEQIKQVIYKCDNDPSNLQREVATWLHSHINQVVYPPSKSHEIDSVIQRSVLNVVAHGRNRAESTDLLLGIMNTIAEGSWLRTFLEEEDIDLPFIKQALIELESPSVTKPEAMQMGATEADPLVQNPEKMNDKKALKILEKYCTNLNKKIQTGEIDPLIGREDDVQALVHTIARRRKSNSILVGPAGVGKTAIAEGLAQKIVDQTVPEVIQNATIWQIDVGDLVAGTRYRGDFEERVKAIISALEEQEYAIMFIDEIHMLLGSGSGANSSIDAANLLKPALARGKIKCIGSTTLEEYRNIFESDRALNRRFQRQDVLEPSQEDTVEILKGIKPHYETFHGVTYDEGTLESAVELSIRYLTNRHLPDKAIDIIDSAGASQSIAKKDTVSQTNIKSEIARLARIPKTNISETEKQTVVDIDKKLEEKVFGQSNAIQTLSRSVKVAKAGLKPKEKTNGVFLFTGPTGTGKTELTKTLSETLDIPLKRFDMSEYMESHSISRLIGAPPGYVGHDESNGLLADAIDESPHSIILFDEIEKAHPSIFNTLLQIMDYGKITNGKGKAIDCRNVYIIMTSNIGSSEIEKPAMGFNVNENISNEQIYDDAVRATFTPEFRNRLDAVVNFNSLTPENIERIVDKFVFELNHLTQENSVSVELTDVAKSWLAEKGYSYELGARPMQRLIHKEIKEPLSEMMISGDLVNGGSAKVDIEQNQICIKTEKK